MSETYNWGIIGAGSIANKMVAALKILPNARVFGVASRNIEKAREFGQRYDIPNCYGSYEELAKSPEIDIVYIATPHVFHFENTMMCLENKKAVLCEKPFAMNSSQVKQMIDSAQRNNVFLMEALWSRFLPNIIEMKNIIDAGEIGTVKLMKCDFGIEVPYSLSHRCINKELGGGSLLDVGIYPVFLAYWLFGKPLKIKALAGMGETGVDLNCSMSFSYEGAKMAVLYSSVIAETDVVAKIYGSEGRIETDRWWFTASNFKIIKNGNEQHRNFDFWGNGYTYEAVEVMTCLDQNKLQSDDWSWQNSMDLIELLDAVREEIGLVYE